MSKSILKRWENGQYSNQRTSVHVIFSYTDTRNTRWFWKLIGYGSGIDKYFGFGSGIGYPLVPAEEWVIFLLFVRWPSKNHSIQFILWYKHILTNSSFSFVSSSITFVLVFVAAFRWKASLSSFGGHQRALTWTASYSYTPAFGKNVRALMQTFRFIRTTK